MQTIVEFKEICRDCHMVSGQNLDNDRENQMVSKGNFPSSEHSTFEKREKQVKEIVESLERSHSKFSLQGERLD